MPDERDDIGADIAEAIAELNGVEAPEPKAAVVEAPVVEAPEGETAAEKQARIDATGRAHDEKGKFTEKPAKPTKGKDKPAKTEAPVVEAKDTPDQKADGDQPKPLQPPSHWTAQAKAEFVNAPRALQEQALKREEEIGAAQKEWGGKAEDYNRIDKVVGPHRDRWARAGMTPDTAINQLLSMERAIASNPVSGITEVLRAFARGNELQVIDQIARANGYQLTKATNQGSDPAEGKADGQSPINLDEHPTVRRLNETIQNLTRDAEARQNAEMQSARNKTLSEIEAFKSDPAHLYYENVKDTMAALLRIGDEAKDQRPIKDRLQEAYDKAVHADPVTRQIVIAEQQKLATAEAARKAAAARHAAGSVTGSPGNGAAAPRPRSQNSSIEDDVREALLEHRA